MPEPRKATVKTHCSFCGGHKDDVQFMATSPDGSAATCITCALTIVHQGVSFAVGIYKDVERQTDKLNESKEQLVKAVGDKADDAINKVQR